MRMTIVDHLPLAQLRAFRLHPKPEVRRGYIGLSLQDGSHPDDVVSLRPTERLSGTNQYGCGS
jgi:hypothetical protein